MNAKLNIAILDDHPLIIKGLASLLRKYTLVKSVVGFSDVKSFRDYLTNYEIDVVILDLRIKGEDLGFEITDFIKNQLSNIKVLIYSSHVESAIVSRCVHLGVDAYVSKDSSVNEIKTALQSLLNNQKYYSTDIHELLSNATLSNDLSSTKNQKKTKLSTREVEIIKLICMGYNYKQISEKLFISQNTVRKHRQNIMHKTDTHNIQALYKYARAMSIINDN